MVNYMDRFSNVEPSWHSWYKSYLVMILGWIFFLTDVLVSFTSYCHNRYWSAAFIFLTSLSDFKIRVMLALCGDFGFISSSSVFLKEFV